MFETHNPDVPLEEPKPQVAVIVTDEPLSLDGVLFPRGASQRIRAMSEIERAAWDADRLSCKMDPLFLGNVLNLDLQENPHRILFDQFLKMKIGVNLADLDPVFRKRMILWSRGHFKTVSVRVFETQLFLNYPNIRICFLTGGDDLAKRQLLALKQVFEKPTERFKYLFPEYVFVSRQNKRTKEWEDVMDELGTAHEFTIPCRTATVFAEPSFWISTAKSVKAGSHADVIVVDDLVNEVNSKNAPQLEKSYQDYLAICPLLDPTGYVLMTGTRYNFGDAYERIQEQAKEAGELSVWKFSIRDCYSAGKCKTCGDPEAFHDRAINIVQPPCTKEGCQCKGFVSDGDRGVLFPQVKTRDGRLIGFTINSLEKIKAELGPQVFANQYLNSPLATETQHFTETMIGAQTLHDMNQMPREFQSSIFIVGDLAYGDAESSDMSVLYVCRKWEGKLYVVDCRAGRWQSHELVTNIVRIILDARPNVVYLEKTLGSEHLHELLIARAKSIGLLQIPIMWVKPSQQKNAKNIRIGNIQEALRSKRLFLYSGMPYYQELVDQLVKWPRLKHDDFADTLGRVAEAPTGWQNEGPPVKTVGNWLRELHKAKDMDDDYTDNGAGTGMNCG